MLECLGHVYHGRAIDYGISGRSAHGGLTKIVVGLRKRNLIDGDYNITDFGRQCYEAKRPDEVKKTGEKRGKK